jgi:small nuclear ribonucleoprotein (snRNP)-like protein
MQVELKSGETLNGHLVNCDTWMNLTLREVIQTSPVSCHIYARWMIGANEFRMVNTS